MSIGGMLVQTVVAPDNVFSTLQSTPPARVYWLLPVLIYILCSIVSVLVIITQPGPEAHLRELGEQDFMPVVEEYVSRGDITKEQGEWFRQFFTPGTPAFLLVQIIGITISAFAILFMVTFIIWQIVRSVLSRSVGYTKVLEITGLAFIIATIERIVSTALIVATGSIFASLSPGLFFLDEPRSLAFVAFSSLNVFTLWQIFVVSTGASIYCGRDFPKVLVLLLALWLLWTLASLFPLFVAG